MSPKKELLQDAEKLAASLTESLPNFDVFEKTIAAFRLCVDELPDSHFSGRDYEIMNHLRDALNSRNTASALLARAFIDIWFCSNFSSGTWRELVADKPDHLLLAIEHCYYVFAHSGADGSAQLAELISDFGCVGVARTHLDRIRAFNDWSARWVDAVAPPNSDLPHGPLRGSPST